MEKRENKKYLCAEHAAILRFDCVERVHTAKPPDLRLNGDEIRAVKLKTHTHNTHVNTHQSHNNAQTRARANLITAQVAERGQHTRDCHKRERCLGKTRLIDKGEKQSKRKKR